MPAGATRRWIGIGCEDIGRVTAFSHRTGRVGTTEFAYFALVGTSDPHVRERFKSLELFRVTT